VTVKVACSYKMWGLIVEKEYDSFVSLTNDILVPD
jgi:hypothetical protein